MAAPWSQAYEHRLSDSESKRPSRREAMGGAEYNWGAPMTLKGVHAFETGLDPHPANFVPLSPVSFLNRAASAFAEKVAVIDGQRSFTYAQLLDRCVPLASPLPTLAVAPLDTLPTLPST